MAKSNSYAVTAGAATIIPTDEKWRQQVRLACVQAVSARAVASHAAYDEQSIIKVANALAEFVLTGAKGD